MVLIIENLSLVYGIRIVREANAGGEFLDPKAWMPRNGIAEPRGRWPQPRHF